MEGECTFEDVSDALDGDNIPNQVPGSVLEPYLQIQDANVADGETIICEWKVGVNENPATVTYCYDPKPTHKRKAFSKESKLPEEMKQIESEGTDLMQVPLS